jgi:hypothetical protein
LLIEVANRMRSRETVRLISVGVVFVTGCVQSRLHMECSFRNASPGLPVPADHLAKGIAQRLRCWLLSSVSPVGERLAVEGYVFQVAVQMPGTNAELAYPQSGGWVNGEDVAAMIKEKVKKYAALAHDLQVPLVVVLGADPGVPLDLDMLRAVMRGQLSTSIRRTR